MTEEATAKRLLGIACRVRDPIHDPIADIQLRIARAEQDVIGEQVDTIIVRGFWVCYYAGTDGAYARRIRGDIHARLFDGRTPCQRWRDSGMESCWKPRCMTP